MKVTFHTSSRNLGLGVIWLGNRRCLDFLLGCFLIVFTFTERLMKTQFRCRDMHGRLCDYELQDLQGKSKRVVIISEAPTNTGMSITNNAEFAIKAVAGTLRVGMSDENMVWVEHYPVSRTHPTATYDRVVINDGRPSWSPIFEKDWADWGVPVPTDFLPRTSTVKDANAETV